MMLKLCLRALVSLIGNVISCQSICNEYVTAMLNYLLAELQEEMWGKSMREKLVWYDKKWRGKIGL